MEGRGICYILCASIFIAFLPRGSPENVTCQSEDDLEYTYCPVHVKSIDEAVKKVSSEDNDFAQFCDKNDDYGLTQLQDGTFYLWVTGGCGGVFEVGSGSGSSVDTNWGAWTACSVSCGHGIQLRTREHLGQHSMDTRNCQLASCPSVVSWNTWGSWGACSKSCGGGTTERVRTCSSGVNTDCSTNIFANKHSKSCNTQDCKSGKVPGAVTAAPNQGLCGQAPANHFGFRIIGGTKAKSCEFPWMVNVLNKKSGTSCGGSIIDKTHILTAAHCVTVEVDSVTDGPAQAEDFKIYTGSNRIFYDQDGSSAPVITRKASSIKIHENFNYDRNDIAIITLAQPIVFDRCHMPICLPSSQQTGIGVSGCKVMGWGTTSNQDFADISSDLLVTDIKVRQPSYCKQHADEGDDFRSDIRLCAGGNGKGSCSGDSGGPLVCPGTDNRYYQFGIVSSGPEGECGTEPGFYTRVPGLLSWIKANTQ